MIPFFGRGQLTGMGNVTVDGDITMAAGKHITMGSGSKLKLDVSTSGADMPLQFNGDPDTGITYVSANNFYVGAQAVTGGMNINGSGFNPIGQVVIDSATTLYFQVRTAPTGLDGYGIIYCDTSGGKDRLRAIFGTGANQAIAAEP